MLRYNRNRARGRFFPLFSPRELFYGSVPGAWYDPTDLSTMFQDSTGTTPVTAVEQPVGRILDKSGNANHATQATAASRPTYRARYNLLTYSEEFNDASWPKSDVSVSANATTAPDGTTTADKLIASATNANHLLNRTATFAAIAGTSYTFSIYAKASEYSWTRLQFQATAFANNWANFNLSNGTVGSTSGVASASIVAVGNGWYRCTITMTTYASANSGVQPFVLDSDRSGVSPSYLGDGTSGIFIWGAQLLTAADVTATGNAYQRIAAATVYDTAPIFRPYLAFDGMDDSLSTAAINFTATDKMTVFAGVTKLSTATFDIASLSPDWPTNNGTFGIGSVSPNGWFFGLRGTAFEYYTATSFVAPLTSVLTSSYNIGGATIADEVVPRVNGTAPTISATGGPAGTGNFGTHVLNISRAASWLNGRIYSLIVRGAASSTTEIADTELWVNARTGAF